MLLPPRQAREEDAAAYAASTLADRLAAEDAARRAAAARQARAAEQARIDARREEARRMKMEAMGRQ